MKQRSGFHRLCMLFMLIGLLLLPYGGIGAAPISAPVGAPVAAPPPIGVIPSTTTITGTSPNPSAIDEWIEVSYTVTSTMALTPTGTVSVTDAYGNSCSGSVEEGSCMLLQTKVGDNMIIASYSGDDTYMPSADMATHTVRHRVVGYFIQWGIYGRNYVAKDVDISGAAEKLTHMLYAFINVKPDPTDGNKIKCASGDPWADYQKNFVAANSVDGSDDVWGMPVRGNFNQLKQLKQKYPHLKILASLGGWTWSSHFSTGSLTAQSRATLVKSCVDMLIKGDLPLDDSFGGGGPGAAAGVFDGIDVDWEYPGACGNTCDYRLEDTENFTELLKEFRSQLNAVRPGLLLSIASSAAPAKAGLMELDEIIDPLDFINVMTYDFHGTWESRTNHQSNLWQNPNDPSTAGGKISADESLQYYLAGGVPAHQLVVGMPFYGKGWKGVPDRNHGLFQSATGAAPAKWEPGSEDYEELISPTGTHTTSVEYWDPYAAAHYSYDGSNFWTYDSPEAICHKANYIIEEELGGAMFWELSGDTPTSTLLTALDESLAGECQTINVTSSPNPSSPMMPFPIKVVVGGGQGTPSGSVTLYHDGMMLSTMVLSDGMATFAGPPLMSGTYVFTATYTGDGTYDADTSYPLEHKVGMATITDLTITPMAPTTYGDQVTFTANVAGTAPTGTVSFYHNRTTHLGTATLSGGTAVFSATLIGAGTYSVTAEYNGDTINNPSVSSPKAHTINKAASYTTLTSSATSSTYGDEVSFTATVTTTAGRATGGVTFYSNGQVIGTRSFVPAYVHGAVNVGGDKVTYNGRIWRAQWWTQNEAPSNGGSGVWADEGPDVGPQATLAITTLPAGSHVITATYLGNANFNASVSNSRNLTVAKKDASVALTSSISTTMEWGNVDFSIVVTSGEFAPTGSVTLYDGGSVLTTTMLLANPCHPAWRSGAPNYVGGDLASYNGINYEAAYWTLGDQPDLNSGPRFSGKPWIYLGPCGGSKASFSTNALSPGTHVITASYSGNSNFNWASSNTITQTVHDVVVNLWSNPSPSVYGEAFQLTAQVTSTLAGAITGDVVFYKDGTAVYTGTLVNAMVSYNPGAWMAAGDYDFTAKYLGDGQTYPAEWSSTLDHEVDKASTSLDLTSSLASSGVGETVTFTATISVVAPGAGTPSGTVTFYNGAIAVGTVTISGGKATWSTSSLGEGTHNITARYNGAANFSVSLDAISHAVSDGVLFFLPMLAGSGS